MYDKHGTSHNLHHLHREVLTIKSEKGKMAICTKL